MSGRQAHLVGSLPGGDAEEAMRTALRQLGGVLPRLPDGETGDRRNWIIHIVESFRSHPDLELVRQGDWSDYDRTPRFRIRKGHQLYGAGLDFGHVAAVQASLPAFDRVAAEFGRDDLVYQVGVPGDFDIAMFTLGPAAALRHRRPFTEATLSEVRRIHTLLGDRAVFQIEIPAELVLLARVPVRGRPAAARLLGRRVAALAAGAAAGTRFGVHLCLGDMNHRALGRMTDAMPLVQLSNALADAWPPARPLEFIHAPLAAADQPPPLEPAFYSPLDRLRLPAGVRFVAGFAHEDQSLHDQLVIRSILDDRLAGPVDISTACGLGRRSPTAAESAMERISALCAQ
ncbi:MAG: hypothetical protein ACKVZ6_01140 [Kineosporiaceae bacterium]|jgi:hypothetical protein